MKVASGIVSPAKHQGVSSWVSLQPFGHTGQRHHRRLTNFDGHIEQWYVVLMWHGDKESRSGQKISPLVCRA
jgi:hypothetical protein